MEKFVLIYRYRWDDEDDYRLMETADVAYFQSALKTAENLNCDIEYAGAIA